MRDGDEAGKRARGGAARRQGARPPGGGRRPGAKTLRVQFHLGEQVVERLRVHTALVHRSDSAVVSEVLLSYLCQHGRGRELFEQDLSPDDGEDRQDGAA